MMRVNQGDIMAWLNTIDLIEEWKQAKAREITPCELGQKVARKLKDSNIYGIPVNIRLDFAGLPEDATFDDFDEVLSDLYDWADYARIWIATF
jgi:hypothetical protein